MLNQLKEIVKRKNIKLKKLNLKYQKEINN